MHRKRTFVLVAVLLALSFHSVRLSAQGVITLTGFDAVMSSSIDPTNGNETRSFLIHSGLFGPGGFAGGLAAVGANPPDDGFWFADPFTPPPDDTMPGVSFLLNPGGTVMGVEPSPFRMFLGQPPPDATMPPILIGELDFSGVTGTSGSLNLSDVVVWEVDALGVQTGEVFDIEPFTTADVSGIFADGFESGDTTGWSP